MAANRYTASPTPLLFVYPEVNKRARQSKDGKDARIIASHVSARYRPWKKTNQANLSLDSTTRAILTSTSTSTTTTTTAVAVAAASSSNGKAIDKHDTGSEYKELVELLDDYHRQMVDRSDHFSLRFSQKTFLFQKESNDTCHLFEYGLVEDRVSAPVGSRVFDPFTPVTFTFDPEMKSNLHFYFSVIRPFARHLMQGWEWLDSLPRVQSSPVLAYGVAAYASAFVSGCLKGGPGVVLPPPVAKGKNSLWPIPPWLRLQTNCLAELNRFLSDPAKIDQSCYEAVLFLFRLSVLLADGTTARMHYKALKRMPTLMGLSGTSLDAELAVAKVNIICAFLHHPSIVVVRTRPETYTGRIKQVVEIDRRLWTSDQAWFGHQASLAGRLLAWRSEAPGELLQKESAASLARLDPGSSVLDHEVMVEMQRCYQIAIYFSVYLNHINFNPSNLEVRSSLTSLLSKLRKMDLVVVSKVCHCALFNILLHGAIASRGRRERSWFVRHMATLYEEAHYMDDVYNMLVQFIDPFGLVFSVIEEIWEDVLQFRASTSTQTQTRKMQLYQRDVVRPIEHDRPVTYSPDLTNPTEIVEASDPDAVAKVELG